MLYVDVDQHRKQRDRASARGALQQRPVLSADQQKRPDCASAASMAAVDAVVGRRKTSGRPVQSTTVYRRGRTRGARPNYTRTSAAKKAMSPMMAMSPATTVASE